MWAAKWEFTKQMNASFICRLTPTPPLLPYFKHKQRSVRSIKWFANVFDQSTGLITQKLSAPVPTLCVEYRRTFFRSSCRTIMTNIMPAKRTDTNSSYDVFGFRLSMIFRLQSMNRMRMSFHNRNISHKITLTSNFDQVVFPTMLLPISQAPGMLWRRCPVELWWPTATMLMKCRRSADH